MKKFNFEINGTKYEVSIKGIEGDTADIVVNGTPYSVKIPKEAETTKAPTLVHSKAANAGAPKVAGPKVTPPAGASKPGDKSVRSPLPGSVIKVNVGVGDRFKDGDVLLIMESMKMENNILAESDGTVTKVNIAEGKAVLQDEILFEYE